MIANPGNDHQADDVLAPPLQQIDNVVDCSMMERKRRVVGQSEVELTAELVALAATDAVLSSQATPAHLAGR
jgi:hypothetical protein